MKQQFANKSSLSRKNKELLSKIIVIIEEFILQGYTLTLRQLYYQLVSRGLIENVTKEYARISHVLVKGRMEGVVDWDAIEDRIRVPSLPYWVAGIDDALNDAIKQYRLDRMQGQPTYIEIWVEKDALSGVLKKNTEHYHVRLVVNRGYSSCTAMHDAYERIKFQEQAGKSCHILYLGDHDPSGVDMVRDIQTRLREFGVNPEVHRIALTQEQIKQYNPPPNPAKLKDTRAKAYIKEFGNMSWEVDALHPTVLHDILQNAIEELVDKEQFQLIIEKEEQDRQLLSDFRNTKMNPSDSHPETGEE